MTEDDIIEFVTALPGVIGTTADADSGAPESAWGDSFFFYDPDGTTAPDSRFPFATIVVSDYEGFDELSKLHRPGVFRVNIGVGRAQFQELFGYPPAAHDSHRGKFDYAALDVLLPHPAYATQSWVSILNPDRTDERARTLLHGAHQRAAARHRPSN